METYINFLIFVYIGVFLPVGSSDAQPNFQTPSLVILNGIPIKKVMSNIEGTELVTMKEEESKAYRVLITQENGKYFWASRNNLELNFSENGGFYDFVEVTGRGYIRIAVVEGRAIYMEHLTTGFKNITYWGIAERFNLK